MTKKKLLISRLLLLLTAICVIMISVVAFQDVWLSPAQQFEKAMLLSNQGAFKKAERYYLLASNADDDKIKPLADYYLGKLYLKKDANFKNSGKKAAKYLTQSADAGLVQAQYDIALLYDIGDKIPENRENAIKYMQKAVNGGYIDAYYSMGVWIERGYFGTIDMKKVIDLYEKAAQYHHLHAMTSLIAIYFGGGEGVPVNKEKASFWMDEIAKIYKNKP